MTDDYEQQLEEMEQKATEGTLPVNEDALAALARFKAEMAGGVAPTPAPRPAPEPAVTVEQTVTSGPVPADGEGDWEDVAADRY